MQFIEKLHMWYNKEMGYAIQTGEIKDEKN